MKFVEAVGCVNSNSWSDFGGGPDYDADTEVFTDFSISVYGQRWAVAKVSYAAVAEVCGVRVLLL